MSNELKSIGKKIREARNSLSMSQSELAHEIGSDKAYVSRIEKGEVNIGVLLLLKLCGAMDVRPNDLVLVCNKTD